MSNIKYSNLMKALCLFSFATFLGLALLTYNQNDPSFNNVTNNDVENYAGVMGAYIADPILQLFGVSSLILVIIPLCWSIICYFSGSISFLFWRVISSIISMMSASILFSYINYNNDYFSNAGGACGILLKKIFPKYLKEYIELEYYQILITFILLVSLYFSLALSRAYWAYMIGFFVKVFYKIISLIEWLMIKIKSRKTIQDKIIPQLKSDMGVKESKIRVDPFIPQAIEQKVNIPIVDRGANKSIIAERKYNIPASASNGFVLPSTELLQNFSVNKDLLQQNKSVIKENTNELSQVLNDFGVSGDIVGAGSGPVVTLYELEPAAGTKSSRIIGLSDDIARSMRATSARIAVIPGRNAIGIELPNKQREMVYLKELLESAEYNKEEYDLPIILGKDISGKVVVADLARMPHLLVAGTTGSGKSVAINTMILSLVYALTPDQCKFIMIDPKMLELSVYDGIPHLLTNVVTEPGKAVVALKWVVKEMETRYRLMSNLGVRNIHNYNERIKVAVENGEIIQRTVQTGFDPETGQPQIEHVPLDMKVLPFIVVIVDEMADLMIVAGKDIEGSIQRLAQMARAAGIHIIMATQRPSVDVITGVIKANFPTRISFQVTSKIDSRTILGEQGAEQLLGKGDMLYMAGGSKITRIHGPFVADNEVEKIVSYLKTQAQPEYMNDITTDDGAYSSSGGAGSKIDNSVPDELYRQAIEIVQLEGKASTSFIQRCLKIGYNRAANIMEQMEREGIVSKANHVGKREILM